MEKLNIVRQRSIFAGGIDYTGVSLDDMIIHIGEWRDLIHSTILDLRTYREQVEHNPKLMKNWLYY